MIHGKPFHHRCTASCVLVKHATTVFIKSEKESTDLKFTSSLVVWIVSNCRGYFNPQQKSDKKKINKYSFRPWSCLLLQLDVLDWHKIQWWYFSQRFSLSQRKCFHSLTNSNTFYRWKINLSLSLVDKLTVTPFLQVSFTYSTFLCYNFLLSLWLISWYKCWYQADIGRCKRPNQYISLPVFNILLRAQEKGLPSCHWQSFWEIGNQLATLSFGFSISGNHFLTYKNRDSKMCTSK